MRASGQAHGGLKRASPAPSLRFLEGGGEMGALIRSFDWTATALGSPEQWSQGLRTILSVLMTSRHPMFLFWGPELIQFYNDGYRPSLGADRHPAALGARGRDFWAEIWSFIGPQIDGAMTRGESTWNEDHLVPIYRNGRVEEVYWTYGFSPVFDDDGAVGGTLVVVQEQTAQVLAARRLRTLRDLGTRTAALRTEAGVWATAADALTGNPHDLPWVQLYTVDANGAIAHLGEQSSTPGRAVGFPARADDRAADIVRRVVETGEPLLLEDLWTPPGDRVVPPWPEPVLAAFLAPIRRSHAPAYGVLVAGLSPRLPFDEPYRDFLLMTADHLAIEINNARTHEEQQRRLEALGRAQRELQGAQERMAFTLAAAGVGYFDLDLTTHRVNRSLRHDQIFGYPAGAPDWSLDAFLGHVADSDRDRITATVREAVGEGRNLEFECPIVAADRRTRWIQVHARIERADNMTPARLLGIVIDVTERRDLLAREQEARKAAEHASHGKDQFLATISHELRTPVNTIVGWSDLLAEEGLDPSEMREGLSTIQRHARAQARMVEDLLDMGRIASGKIHVNARFVALEDVVRQAMDSVTLAAQAKGVRLVADGLTAEGIVAGDAGLLQQVFWNLLGNAVKFTPAGGTVEIGLGQTEKRLDVTIRDTGEGLRPEFLPYVFERFRQADGTTMRSHGGLGIGLSLAKQLVEVHGGTVTAASPGLGQGSTFTVSLPLAAPRQGEITARHAEAPAGPTPLTERLRGRRILVVEDDADTRGLIERIFTGARAHVVGAGSTAEALGVLSHQTFDLLVTDIGMPQEDGYDLLRKIRSLPPSRGGAIPAVALTAYARPEDRQRCLEAGFQAHLAKPIQQWDLLSICGGLVATSPTDF